MNGFVIVLSASVLVVAGAACTLGAPGGAEDVATVGARVESTYRWTQFEYLFQPDEASVATAALVLPHLDADGVPMSVDGIPIRSTCGVTFVSAHYAITAAHCVPAEDIPDPASAMFTVKSFDISGVSWEKLVAAQQLNGWFPTYSHATLTEADGYHESSLNQCHVIHRCSAQYGAYNCDLEADIALIKCEDRSPFGPYMDVARTDDLQGPVEVRWYHEVFDVPRAQPVPPTPGNPLADAIYEKLLDRWDHYVNRAFQMEDNYHYFANNQLFPLVSSPWYVGDLVFPRTRTGVDPRTPTVAWTDLFGCHGTSGSGVTQIGSSGRHELLGPVVISNEPNARLCDDRVNARGQSLLSYTRLGYTRWMYTTVLNDPNEFWLFGKPEQ